MDNTGQKLNELPQSPISRQLNQAHILNQPIQSQEIPPISPPPEPKKPMFSFKNLFKLLIGLVAVFIAVIILFGVVFPKIGSKNGSGVELSFSGVFDQKVMDSVLSEFEKENPQIKVSYTKEDLKDYKDRLTTKIKNGTGADVFMFNNTWYLQLRDILLPVSSGVVSKDDFDKSYYPIVKRDLVKNGAIYGIPLGMDTLSLYVNSDLLRQAGLNAPKTWDEFVNVSRALTVKDQTGKIKTSGAALGTYDNVIHAADLISLLFAQDGVDLGSFTPKDRVSDALNFYSSFAREDTKVWDNTLDSSVLAFSKGNLAMLFAFYWDYQNIKSANPNLSFDIFPVPQLTGQSINIANYWAAGVSAKGSHQKEALLLLKFLSRREVPQKLSQPSPFVADSESLRNTPAFVFSSQAATSVSSYLNSQQDNGLSSKLSASFGLTINSILNGTDSNSAAATLVSNFSQILGITSSN